jgi:hypothetical protein
MKRLFFFIVLLFALAASTLANTGKIAGRVVDDKGEGIYGACVLIVETQQGACVQSLDGSYVIIGVPPGKYTIRIASIAYMTQTLPEVLVVEEETTTLNVTLAGAVQEEKGCPVFKKPVVKPDTGSENPPDSMGKPAKKLSHRIKGSISDGDWGCGHPSVRRVNTIGVPAHILVQYKIPARVRYR